MRYRDNVTVAQKCQVQECRELIDQKTSSANKRRFSEDYSIIYQR